MTFNTRIRIQYKTTRKIGLLSLSDSIREDTRSHDKKENEKRNTTNHRDTTDDKRRRTREPHIRILKETIDISRRQE